MHQENTHRKSALMETSYIDHWKYSTQTYSDIGMHSGDAIRCRNQNGEMIDIPVPRRNTQNRILISYSYWNTVMEATRQGMFMFSEQHVFHTFRMCDAHCFSFNQLTVIAGAFDVYSRSQAFMNAIQASHHRPVIRSHQQTRRSSVYWRGAIWTNVNYLADALMYYSNKMGHIKKKSKTLAPISMEFYLLPYMGNRD
uniref:AlNc14C15G1711 protein n=1 Tax=Albugo laibachii Nc14 TaxID=890382 RepID=F0W424_9STRA|nr:AlNc14C15G1711 [Albugo laibachii Nc14]|eukprot:CCA15821.1 AlNc14C15G1711 [Albugo laibachii Nc14]